MRWTHHFRNCALAVLLVALGGPPGAATLPVAMSNFQFAPANPSINVGDTVTWTVQQGFHDTVSGANGVPTGLWNSGTQFGRLMSPGESFSLTFNAPGTFPYFCTPHWPIGMAGSIQVIAANAPPIVSILSPANGATFSPPASITFQVSASDPDGSITQVQFLLNGTPVGAAGAPPFNITINDLGPGNYVFSAVATDNARRDGKCFDINQRRRRATGDYRWTAVANGERRRRRRLCRAGEWVRPAEPSMASGRRQLPAPMDPRCCCGMSVSEIQAFTLCRSQMDSVPPPLPRR